MGDRHPLQAFAAHYGASDPDAAMLAACRDLLDATEQHEGPVSLAPIMSRLRARREVAPLPTAGRLELDAGGYLITVRASSPWRRARFTVAHELGHILIYEALAADRRMVAALQDPSHWSKVERLCNRAAAELLMPRQDFERAARDRPYTPAGLRRLFDRYLVSWHALLVRAGEVLGTSVSLWDRWRRSPAEQPAMRVVRAFGDREAWLPSGMTTKHVGPNVIERAVERGSAFEEDVRISFGGRRISSPACAISLRAASEAGAAGAPRLEGFPVPDDPIRGRHAVALLRTNLRFDGCHDDLPGDAAAPSPLERRERLEDAERGDAQLELISPPPDDA